tara:strand:- start:458 stop:622 length:165 start_codon:yes stop_codon:yes gene_type:complete
MDPLDLAYEIATMLERTYIIKNRWGDDTTSASTGELVGDISTILEDKLGEKPNG